MKRISDYAKSWKNDCTCVNRLLYEWHPRSFTLSEQELQQDLQKWLQLNLSDVPILVTEPPAVQIAGLPNVKFAFGILEDVNPVHGSEIGLAPEAGLEPATHRLTADCSTIELLWNVNDRILYKSASIPSNGFTRG